MVDTRIKPSNRLPGGPTNSPPVNARGLVDGSAFTADWLARMALEGRMYTANGGTQTAPFTGGGAFVNTAPDLDMSVPSGVLVIPIQIEVTYETWGTGLLSETVAMYGKGGVIVPTSATDVVPINHRLDLGNDSGVTVKSDGTGATFMTPAASIVEFWRPNSQFSITKTAGSATVSASDPSTFKWSALETGVWPIMYATDGITRLNIFASAQGPTLFISVTFVKPPLVAE